MRREKILVADDDVQFVDSVKTLLESTGYTVFYTYRSKDVIDKAKDIIPDLILLDVMFAGPLGPDGIKLSRLIHQDPILKDIPVIIIEKPVRPDVLLSEIEKVLGPKT